ncbi:bifunctional protein GlmU [bacterium BMS3Bbin04]|nr:bifunctional protein GlmU [bacterium BMS3Bbin04]
MIAVILVAGNSARMGSLTADVHKSLLPVANLPIISRILNALESNEIDRVVFVGGSMEDQLKEYVAANHGQLQTKWVTNPGYATTNTAYSVWLTDSTVGRNEDMILINGDVVMDARAISRTLKGRAADEKVSVLATRFSDVDDEEVKVLVKDNLVTEIGKHIDPVQADGESVGINLIARSHLNVLYATLRIRIAQGEGRTEYYEHAFNQMVNDRVPFHTADVTDLPVMEIDTPEDYETVQRELSTRLSQ